MLDSASASSPLIGEAWRLMHVADRVELVQAQKSVFAELQMVEITRCLDDGGVYLNFLVPISAADRGLLLRRFEKVLKERIDSGITLWCEPLGDKNSLRKLRGIEIIS